MSRHCVFSPRAQQDLDEIWDYTFVTWGVEYADAYIREIHAALATLINAPRLGRDCAHTRAGYRKYPVGSHMLFYRLLANDIAVIRVLHQRMDKERHL